MQNAHDSTASGFEHTAAPDDDAPRRSWRDRLPQWSIRTKLLAGIGSLLVVAAALAVVAEVQATGERQLAATRGKEALVGRAQAALWELRYGFPQYLVLTDEENRRKIVDAEPALYREFENATNDYVRSPGLTEQERALSQQLLKDFDLYKEARPRWFQLISEGKNEEAAAWRAKTTTPYGAALVKGVAELLTATEAADAQRTEAALRRDTLLGHVQAALGVLLVLLGAFVAWTLNRAINKPLARLQATIDRLSQGDTEARARLGTADELGVLAANFDALLDARVEAERQVLEDKRRAEAENERLNNSVISILQAVNQLSQRDLTARAPVTQDIIGTVSDSINQLTDETTKVLQGVSRIAGQVADASGTVKQQADMVSRTAEEERRSVAEMIRALDEASQVTQQVVTVARQSNVQAEQATVATDAALQTVTGTVTGMESIRETIAETEKRIKRLGERSQEITGIVNLINTISERTHVLALNASMQAAVAGEAGRGFAVVAEEVQRLAESSRNATQQIGTLVQNIQLETSETISTVNRTIGQVVQGSEQARKAGEQMRRTQEITGALVEQVRRIAEASQRQQQVSEQLLVSVQGIGQSTERTAEQIQAQNRETETLLDSARRLVDSVNVFKLSPAAA